MLPPAVLVALMIAAPAPPPAEGAGAEGHSMSLKIESRSFASESTIPKQHTCDGADLSPALTWAGAPAGTKSFALICDDPDAPVGTWVHWVVWNIPPAATAVPAGSVPKGALQGTNDFGRRSYGGPCPPSGTHRYFFKLYALDTTLSLGSGTTKKELERAMAGHILAHAELKGTYRRR